MVRKIKKEKFAIVISEKDAKVLDNPMVGSPVVCELSKGTKVKIISKPNKQFYGIGISNSVVGFVARKDVKTE